MTATLVLEETRAQVRAAVARLPTRCQRMIRMLFYQQPPLPYRDIAERLDMAPGSVPFVRARCLARLLRELER